MKLSLRNLLIDLQVKLERLSEIDLIVYLKAVVKIGIKDIIVSIIRYFFLDNKYKDIVNWTIFNFKVLDTIYNIKHRILNYKADKSPLPFSTHSMNEP